MRILPLRGISLKDLLMQIFQTAPSVPVHRAPHSAKPHPRILPLRGISLKDLLMQIFQTAPSVRFMMPRKTVQKITMQITDERSEPAGAASPMGKRVSGKRSEAR